VSKLKSAGVATLLVAAFLLFDCWGAFMLVHMGFIGPPGEPDVDGWLRFYWPTLLGAFMLTFWVGLYIKIRKGTL